MKFIIAKLVLPFFGTPSEALQVGGKARTRKEGAQDVQSVALQYQQSSPFVQSLSFAHRRDCKALLLTPSGYANLLCKALLCNPFGLQRTQTSGLQRTQIFDLQSLRIGKDMVHFSGVLFSPTEDWGQCPFLLLAKHRSLRLRYPTDGLALALQLRSAKLLQISTVPFGNSKASRRTESAKHCTLRFCKVLCKKWLGFAQQSKNFLFNHTMIGGNSWWWYFI